MHSIDKAGRRRHTTEFKQAPVATCKVAGVSLAPVALEKRINANLLRRRVKLSASRASAASIVETAPAAAQFVPVRVTRTKPDAQHSIRIEVHKGATRLVVERPMAHASACGAWLRDPVG